MFNKVYVCVLEEGRPILMKTRMTTPETTIQTTGIAEIITYGPISYAKRCSFATSTTNCDVSMPDWSCPRWPTYIPSVSSSLRFEALTTAGTMCLRS